MLKLRENIEMNDGLFVIKGNVKIYDGDKLILDKDNAITNSFRKILMTKLYNDIVTNNAGLTTVSPVGTPSDVANDVHIYEVKFGRGSSSSLGAKASKDDISLVSAIPSVTSDDNSTPLYINTNIRRDLNVNFNFNDLNIQFAADLINNDSITYVLGELGIFTYSGVMLTHLFFDPIYFEPDTTKKIVYTIYLY
jgi:hypothetical protein